MFGMFSKKKEIKGEIGYFGLQEWWVTELKQEERDHIEEIFHPLGSEPNDKPLTEGEISYSSGTAVGLLHALAGWFNNPKDREIAKKIIEKANELAPKEVNILDYHFTLQQTMEIYYRERDTSPEALEKALQACRKQISIAPQASAAFLKEYPEQPLPAHAGYRQLRIVLEKQEKYDEAIILCEQAKKQGWADNWDKQIETLRKKKEKQSKSRSDL
jgi:tetratricopeptide (TPR) repeat protein